MHKYFTPDFTYLCHTFCIAIATGFGIVASHSPQSCVPLHCSHCHLCSSDLSLGRKSNAMVRVFGRGASEACASFVVGLFLKRAARGHAHILVFSRSACCSEADLLWCARAGISDRRPGGFDFGMPDLLDADLGRGADRGRPLPADAGRCIFRTPTCDNCGSSKVNLILEFASMPL